jgi:hypothetical protein
MDPTQPSPDFGKVLEVGSVRLLAGIKDYSVHFVDTRFSILPGLSLLARLKYAVKHALSLFNEIRRPEYRLIVCRCFGRFAWSRNHSWITNTIRWLMRQFLAFCIDRRSRSANLVIVDFDDELTIDRRDLRLLKECDLYFKRELAQNAWTNLLRAQPLLGEYQAMMQDPRFRKMIGKFRPISLGIPEEQLAAIQSIHAKRNGLAKKQFDIFFAGSIDHSTVREMGVHWLQQLKSEGYAVYLPEGGLPSREFNEALSASWLVWSPEGSGWDCFRHYEVCLAGSVPVINFPTIRRYAPLEDGVHCIYYGIEGDDLLRKIKTALVDKPRLIEMAQAGRQYVLGHHTRDQVGNYVLSESERLFSSPEVSNPAAELTREAAL